MSSQGKAWWNELRTRDVLGSKAFYSKVVGWQFDEMDMDDGSKYHVCLHPQGPAGGIFYMAGKQFDRVPQHWMVYFAVDDADSACEAIKKNYGAIWRQPFDMPGVGRIAVASDPSGALFGIVTPEAGATDQQ